MKFVTIDEARWSSALRSSSEGCNKSRWKWSNGTDDTKGLSTIRKIPPSSFLSYNKMQQKKHVTLIRADTLFLFQKKRISKI